MKKALLLLLITFIFFSVTQTLASGPYEYSIEVNTASSVYTLGDSVRIFGTLTSEGNPISTAEIGVQINTPIGMFHVNQIKTDQNGYFEDIFQLGDDSLTGFYTVYVTAGNQISEKSFEVIANSKTLTIYVNKDSFIPGELVAIGGSLYEQEFVQNEPIAVQVINSNYGPVFLDQILTNEFGNYLVGFNLPANSLPGQYRIFVAAKGIYSIEYFEVD
jgi:uncharacterized protein YfaS (alpha-2-macroglobulin family)